MKSQSNAKYVLVKCQFNFSREKGVEVKQESGQCKIIYFNRQYSLSREEWQWQFRVKIFSSSQFLARKVSMIIKGQSNAKYFCVKHHFNGHQGSEQCKKNRVKPMCQTRIQLTCQWQSKVSAMSQYFISNANAVWHEIDDEINEEPEQCKIF